MKKIRYVLPLTILGMLLASCSNGGSLAGDINKIIDDLPSTDIDTPWEEYDNPLADAEFKQSDYNVTLDINDEEKNSHTYVPLSYSPRGAIINYVSSNESVVTVDKNTITAVSTGEATITVKGSERSTFTPIEFKVSVIAPIQSFELDQTAYVLDYGEKAVPVVTYTPTNTTQKELSYSIIDGEEFISVNNGEITALNKEGIAHIQVTSPYINGSVADITVTVQDKAEYIATLTSHVTGLEDGNRLELGKKASMSATFSPSTATYQTIRYHTSTPAFVSVDDVTGEITAIKAGEAKVYSTIFEDRKGKDFVSDPVTFNVYEVKATEIHLNKNVLELDNVSTTSETLTYSYVLDDMTKDAPSKKEVSFSIDDDSIASVSQDGVVSAIASGTAIVTVKDSYANIQDTCTVNVTINSTAVTISGKKDAYSDESVTLTANITPAGVTDSTVVFNCTSGNEEELNILQENEKLTISTNVEEGGTYTFTATNGSITSVPFTVTFTERPVEFESGSFYLVGTSSFRNGVSTDHEGGSWEAAKYAYKFTEKTQNPNAKYEYYGLIEFREGDIWKIKEGKKNYKEIEGKGGEGTNTYATGIYKVDKDAFASGGMGYQTEGDKNLVCLKSGKYEVYYAFYDDNPANPEGWYEVSVVDHGMTIDKSEIVVQKDHSATITATKAIGTVNVSISPAGIATVSKTTVESVTTITVTGSQVGQATLTISDNEKQFVVPVDVRANAVVQSFEDGHYYLVGNADFSSGTSVSGNSSWNNPVYSIEFPAMSNGESKLTMVLHQGDEFKIRLGETYPEVNAEQLSAIPDYISRGEFDYYVNYVVLVDGEYDLYFKQGSGYSLYIEKTPTLSIDNEKLTVELNSTGVITYSNARGTVTATSSNTSIATVSVNSGAKTVTVSGVNDGSATITIDDTKNTVTCLVTVVDSKPDFENGKLYVVGNKDYSTGSSISGDSWNDVTKALQMQSVDKESYVSQYKATVTFAKHDEWRIRFGTGWLTAELEVAGAITSLQMHKDGDNMIVDVAGTYDIYIKETSAGVYSMYINPEESTKQFTVNYFDHFLDGDAWIAIWAWSGSNGGQLYTGYGLGNSVIFSVPKTTDGYIIFKMKAGAPATGYPSDDNVWNRTDGDKINAGDNKGFTVKGYYDNGSWFVWGEWY